MSIENRGSPVKEAADLRLPDGVIIPESVESSRGTLFSGDVVDMLKQLPIEKINAAFDTFDYQCNLRGDEIRNRRAYLRGILKGHLGRSDLPRGVHIPPSINQQMFEDKDLMDILKNMSVRDINSCFRDYDEQMKKKSGMIRNKSAYLLGIIKSGPHYNLPQGVVLPSTLSLAMLQGELLETIQLLPAAHINVAFSEYDEQVQKKGDTIRNRQGYLLGIIKRMKRTFEEEAAGHIASTQKQQGISGVGSPNKEALSPYSPQSKNGKENGAVNSPRELSLMPSAESQGTLNLVTESFVKVTNELVIERQARNDLQDQMKQEQNRREETNQRILKLMSDLAVEKEQRERSALEVQRLKKDLAFERSLRETAEEKVQMLEQTRGIGLEQHQQLSPGTEQAELQKLAMDLSKERTLREKTEKLLQTAEIRIQDLNRELKYVQDRLHEERTKSPFGSWMASPPLGMTSDIHSEDKKTPELPPSLSGISELVSMTEFDPETFTFTNKTQHIPLQTFSPTLSRTHSGELAFVQKIYSNDEVLITSGEELIRFLQLDVGKNAERVQVNLKLHIPSGFPGSGALRVNAVAIAKSAHGDNAKKDVESMLPTLLEACRTEAKNCSGEGAVLSVLTTADYWAQNDWIEWRAKQQPAHGASKTDHLEICRMLLQASGIKDPQTLRHVAAKHGFGGCVRMGEPGVVMLEGLNENSSRCLQILDLYASETSRQGSMWTTLSILGRSTQMAETLASGLLLPKKLASLNSNDDTEKLKTICKQVGLSEALSKVIP